MPLADPGSQETDGTFEFQTAQLKCDESIADFDQMNHTIQTVTGQNEKITRIDFAKT